MVCLVAGRMGRIENKREKIRLCAVFFFFFFFLINLFIYKDASHVTFFFFFLLLTHKGTKSTQQYPSFLFFKSPYIIVLGFFNPSPN